MAQGTITTMDQLEPQLKADVQKMIQQILIVLVKRAGGSLVIPVSEVDDTSQDMLEMGIDQISRTYTFTASKKS